jgi:hypothetical protein
MGGGGNQPIVATMLTSAQGTANTVGTWPGQYHQSQRSWSGAG